MRPSQALGGSAPLPERLQFPRNDFDRLALMGFTGHGSGKHWLGKVLVR